MAFKLDKENDYSDYNQQFNNIISTIVGNIFQSEKIGMSGYIFGGAYQEPDFKSSPISAENELKFDRIKNQRKKLPDIFDSKNRVGPDKVLFETVLSTCILTGDSTIYTLVGAMGSGKSTSIQYITKTLQEVHPKKFYNIYINFNEGYSQEDEDLAYAEFTRDLVKLLKANIEDLILEHLHSFFNDFESAIKKEIKLYSYFYDIKKEVQSKTWLDKSNSEKIEAVYNYISKESKGNDERYVKGLMFFLKILKEKYLDTNGIMFFTCYDNVDKFSPSLQVRILKFILQTQRASKVRCLIPIRRSTFSKLRTRAALSFQNINQTGPKPLGVIISILETVEKEWEKLSSLNGLDDDFSKTVLNKFIFLREHLNDPKSRTRSLFENLSGKSIKIGLRLANRFIISNFIPWDKEPDDANSQFGMSLLIPFHYNNSYLSTILKSENCDREVCNIFSLTDKNELSLLKIRILQLLKNFENKPESRRVMKLLSIIDEALYSPYSNKIYLGVLNDLLFDERPLIGGEKKARYDSFQDLFETNDILRLTELGEGYLRLLGDTRYIQESLFSVNSEHIRSRSIGTRINERFSALREYIYVIIDSDIEDTEEFLTWSKDRNFIDQFNPKPISHYILYKAATAFLAISLNVPSDEEKIEYEVNNKVWNYTIKNQHLDEFRNWSTLLYYAYDEGFFSHKLFTLFERFEKLITDTSSIDK